MSILGTRYDRIEDPRKAEIFGMSLEELITICGSEDYLERGYAAQALGRFQHKKALPALLKLALEDEHLAVRADALVALMLVDGAAGEEAFIAALGEEEDFIVLVALEALAKFPSKNAAPKLEELLSDERGQGEISLHSAIALSALKKEVAQERLMSEVEQGKNRYISLNALMNYDELPSNILERTEKFHKRWFLHPLEKLESAAILTKHGNKKGLELIIKRLYSNKMIEKGYAIDLCCRLKIDEAMNYIYDIASDERHYYCANALWSLANWKHSKAFEIAELFAVKALEPEIKAESIRVLFYGKSPAAKTAIQTALKDSSLEKMRPELQKMAAHFEEKPFEI